MITQFLRTSCFAVLLLASLLGAQAAPNAYAPSETTPVSAASGNSVSGAVRIDTTA